MGFKRLALLVTLAGCAPAARQPVSPPSLPPPPVVMPQYEKTHGEIAVGQRATLAFKYKSLNFLVDTDMMGQPEIKGAKAGKRTMLKKDNDFVFVSAMTNRNVVTKEPADNYLLEFDNGRNIFIAGDVTDIESLRDFLYDIRDEGKEIYAGFFFRGPGADEATLAQFIGILQPSTALIGKGGADTLPPLDQAALQQALKNELFEGAAVPLMAGSTIPF